MKRKLTWAAILIAAAAGMLVLVYTWRGVLIVPHLTALIRETVRQHLGLEVSIGHVARSLPADLEISDIQTVTPAAKDPCPPYPGSGEEPFTWRKAVRLDLAFNPDRDPDRDEDRYVVHFSVGMAF